MRLEHDEPLVRIDSDQIFELRLELLASIVTEPKR